MLALKDEAKMLLDYPIYYHEAFEDVKKSVYDVNGEQWTNDVNAIVPKLHLDPTTTLFVLTVGCGNGQVDEPIIHNLIGKYANITYIAVEPVAEVLSKFRDLTEYKSDKWCNVTFDFQTITIEKYFENNGDKQFGMVVAFHSAYYFKHLEDTTIKLYNCLVKGGMLYFKIGDGGSIKLHEKLGEYYRSSNYNFIGSHAIEDIFKRRLPHVRYQTKRRQLSVDVINCFDEEPQQGSYVIDFITQIYEFRVNCKPEIKKQLLNYMRDECCTKVGIMLLLNADEKDLIILKD